MLPPPAKFFQEAFYRDTVFQSTVLFTQSFSCCIERQPFRFRRQLVIDLVRLRFSRFLQNKTKRISAGQRTVITPALDQGLHNGNLFMDMIFILWSLQ